DGDERTSASRKNHFVDGALVRREGAELAATLDSIAGSRAGAELGFCATTGVDLELGQPQRKTKVSRTASLPRAPRNTLDICKFLSVVSPPPLEYTADAEAAAASSWRSGSGIGCPDRRPGSPARGRRGARAGPWRTRTAPGGSGSARRP